jgi:hypothetical protein
MITQFSPGKVLFSKTAIALFNARWPCSPLRSTRTYYFEFSSDGDLVDTDVPEHEDGDAALALSKDAEAWLFEGTQPEWIP